MKDSPEAQKMRAQLDPSEAKKSNDAALPKVREDPEVGDSPPIGVVFEAFCFHAACPETLRLAERGGGGQPEALRGDVVPGLREAPRRGSREPERGGHRDEREQVARG